MVYVEPLLTGAEEDMEATKDRDELAAAEVSKGFAARAVDQTMFDKRCLLTVG